MFCKSIFKQCYGVMKWKHKVMEEKISDFMMPSFEAFVLLAYENYYKSYTAEVVEGVAKPPFKYTSRSCSSPRNKGWPAEAIAQYNALHMRIIADRRANANFDKEFLQASREEMRTRRNRVNANGNGNVVPMLAVNDMLMVENWERIG